MLEKVSSEKWDSCEGNSKKSDGRCDAKGKKGSENVTGRVARVLQEGLKSGENATGSGGRADRCDGKCEKSSESITGRATRAARTRQEGGEERRDADSLALCRAARRDKMSLACETTWGCGLKVWRCTHFFMSYKVP
jgi:hypothetical protein